jgi:hypothetical protein
MVFLDRYSFHMAGKNVERTFNSLPLLPILFSLLDILPDPANRPGQGSRAFYIVRAFAEKILMSG